MLLQDREIYDHQEFKANQTIFVENHPARRAYLITKGQVALSYKKGDQDAQIRIAKKGEIIGDLDWLNNREHLFTAKAVDDIRCLRVPYENLMRHYVRCPPSVQGILRNAVNTFRALKGEEKSITVADVKAIINEELISLADDGESEQIKDVLDDTDSFSESVDR